MTHDDQLAQFLAGKPVAIDAALRSLPRNANLELAVAVVLRLLEQPHWLAAAGTLPVRLIRGVIAAPATTPNHVFLQLAVPDGSAPAMKSAWLAAVSTLRDLADTLHPLETPARREVLAAIAKSPLVPAIQGVVANSAEVALEMLVVLALDGSDASLDALIPHLDLALGARDARLERLAKIRPFVRSTPALDALFAELDGALAARRSTSPALAFGEALGLGRLDEMWFSFQLMSTEAHHAGLPRYQGRVRIDSREDPWFAVELQFVKAGPDRSHDKVTRFDLVTTHDEIGIGRCQPAELPAWLRSIAGMLKLSWNKYLIRTNADPKKIETWLITG